MIGPGLPESVLGPRWLRLPIPYSWRLAKHGRRDWGLSSSNPSSAGKRLR